MTTLNREEGGNTATYVSLMFPNNTQVTITGDHEVVEQLIKRLHGLVIDYEAKL